MKTIKMLFLLLVFINANELKWYELNNEQKKVVIRSYTEQMN